MLHPMGAAVAVQERPERPGVLERILVLGICAALLVTLGILDHRAATREKARAYQVIAERAKEAGERSNRESMRPAPADSPAPRTDRVGGTPIVVAGGHGIGAPQNVLHRAQGPRTSDSTSAIPEPAVHAAAPAPAPVAATAPAVATSASRGQEPLLLALMAALGLSMAGGGLRLLSRRSA